MDRRLLAAAAAALLLAGCGGGGKPKAASSPIPTPELTVPDPVQLTDVHPIPISYAVLVDDKTLDVYYTGSANRCQRLARVHVHEGPDANAITLYLGSAPQPKGSACAEVASVERTRVGLKDEVGKRKLIDGGAKPPTLREIVRR